MQTDPPSKFCLVRNQLDRIRLVLFAIVIWVIAGWMFWMVETFADGRDHWDYCVRLVLHDLVFAIMIFGLALVIHACFPRYTGKLVEKTAAKLNLVLLVIVLLVFSTLAFVSLGLPLLNCLGIIGQP